jgi:general stress protein YciG
MGFKGNRERASEAGKRGAATVMERLGVDYYARIGRVGGNLLKEKVRPGYYSEIGKKGAAKRWHGGENEGGDHPAGG